MARTLYINIFILLCTVSINCGEFTYDELMQRTHVRPCVLQTRLLGHLATAYRRSQPVDQSTDYLIHRVTGVPSYKKSVDIDVQVGASRVQSIVNGKPAFELLFSDRQETIVTCDIKENDNGSRYSDGSIYWDMPQGYINPIPASTLMNLRDSVLKILGVSEYRLADRSWDHKIVQNFGAQNCPSLRVLGAYMHGKTYYESTAGFQPMGTPAEVAAYHEAQQLLYHLPFSKVCQDYAGVPAIEQLKRTFPDETRFGAVVKKLYQASRSNDRRAYERLKWVNRYCLSMYPDHAPSSAVIQNAQELILNREDFNKLL